MDRDDKELVLAAAGLAAPLAIACLLIAFGFGAPFLASLGLSIFAWFIMGLFFIAIGGKSGG